MDRLIQVLKLRTRHHDPDVRQISQALLEHLRLFPNGWVVQTINSSQMSVYKNHLEKILVLEKTIIHHFLGDFWYKAITHPQAIPQYTSLLKERYSHIFQTGWFNLISEISIDEAKENLGKPIPTNRYVRYHNLWKKVISPLLLETFGSKELHIIDAGSASGIGSHSAVHSILPIKSWIGIDKLDPIENLPWILTSSVRIGEILSNKSRTTIKQIMKLPPYFRFSNADLENLSAAFPANSIDIYIAIFSYYQLADPQRAFNNALEILRPGGLFIITDHLSQSSPGKYSFAYKHSDLRLQTLVLKKKLKGQRVKMLQRHFWKDADLKQKSLYEYKLTPPDNINTRFFPPHK